MVHSGEYGCIWKCTATALPRGMTLREMRIVKQCQARELEQKRGWKVYGRRVHIVQHHTPSFLCLCRLVSRVRAAGDTRENEHARVL